MKYVYMLRNGQDYYKVGIAVNVASRVQTIQTSNPEKVTVVCCRLVADAEEAERRIHQELVERKTGGGQEWFMLTPDDALEVAALINLEPQPKVLDRQITVESLLATMRAERLEMLREVNELKGLIASAVKIINRKQGEVKTVAVSAPIRPVVREVERIKPSIEHYERLAMNLFRKHDRVSASFLQSRLGIGYAKASRIIDTLEEKGLVSPPNGNSSRGRTLLVDNQA
ncbi:GIY-YIG nuclease family protein [Rhodococcus ruber]|uniref:GIY-YIG nuclease family protein n=1 Tax=Rhodococcus ruber TaxID=1830 RepID=UPI001F1CE640|nr:DNA translocase FtsK [Rhodococcus ruber]MCF8783181.1 GIY-YIG nuclease family protein [Rhodococcus ruber]